MRVLIVNTSESTGGAAVAAGRLMHALKTVGVEVSMLVRDRKTDNPDVHTVSGSPFRMLPFLLERLRIVAGNRFKTDHLFEVSLGNTGFDITRMPVFQNADVIHLHWINQGMLSLKGIREILQSGKPVVWTMHDMWPLTGICHYSGHCEAFGDQCGNCPLLVSTSPSDLSNRNFLRKNAIWRNLQFVTCSRWLMERCITSQLLQGSSINQIHNPIDTSLYQPGDQKEARRRLGLPEDMKLILFGAYSLTDQRKGMHYLMEASRLLSDWSDRAELVFCGGEKKEMAESFGLQTRSLGYIDSPEKMVLVYQAVDCYVIPSLQENLPNMVMEAMACGIPCIGFRTGGIPEMIDHTVNGFLAQTGSSGELAQGIRFVLGSTDPSALSASARNRVMEHYSEAIVAQKYLNLYESLLS